MHRKAWERSVLNPKPGTHTDILWQPEYPVWIGADKSLSKRPLPYPGKVQVTGHVQISKPEANSVRIRLDTRGGYDHLTACLLRSGDTPPVFITSQD
jgi:serine/threonine protein phosphatase 1